MNPKKAENSHNALALKRGDLHIGIITACRILKKLNYAGEKPLETIDKFLKYSGRLAGLLGATLFIINFAGVLAGKAFYYFPEHVLKHPINQDFVDEPLVLSKYNRRNEEPKKNYVQRVNKAISVSLIHYFEPKEVSPWVYVSRRVCPVTENFVLYTQGIIEYYTKKRENVYIEYTDSRLALKRGYGFCSQAAKILVDILTKNNIPGSIISLSGHVVATAEVAKGEWWIVDPDYGVTIPHSLEAIENDPGLIKHGYFSSKAGQDAETIELLTRLYGTAENNQIYTKAGYEEGLPVSMPLAYFLKWTIPLIFLTLLCFTELMRKIIRYSTKKE